MRIVAAFGIVWFHLQAPGAWLGALGLSLFLMLTGELSWDSVRRRGGGSFWRRRAARLLGPWLAWCGVYLAVEAERFGWHAALTLQDPLTLLVGPEIHLWFLPFAALASGLAVAGDRVLTSAARVRAAALALPLACVLPVWAEARWALPAPFAQWSVALAPFVYGVLAGAGRSRGAPLAAGAFAALAAGLALAGGSTLAPLFLLGAAAFEALRRLPVRHPWLPALGGLTFGVYFVHPLVALAWYRFGGTGGAGGAAALFAGSALVAAALGAIRSLVTTAGRATTPPARGPA